MYGRMYTRVCGRSSPFWNGYVFLCNLGCYEGNLDIEGELWCFWILCIVLGDSQL